MNQGKKKPSLKKVEDNPDEQEEPKLDGRDLGRKRKNPPNINEERGTQTLTSQEEKEDRKEYYDPHDWDNKLYYQSGITTRSMIVLV